MGRGKYKQGDIVVCFKEPKPCSENNGGHGFKANYCFEITSVTRHEDQDVLWGGNNNDSGVYEDSVRMATPYEKEKFKREGKFVSEEDVLETDFYPIF